MNYQHVILYQNQVKHYNYILSLLANNHEIIVHVTKDLDAIKERIKFNQIDCILYECDVFTRSSLMELKKIAKLNIPYLILTEYIQDNIYLDQHKVILKNIYQSQASVLSSQLIVAIKSMYSKTLKVEKTIDLVSSGVIAIGASTGGPHAISMILKELPLGIEGIVIVQHMSDNNIDSFVEYLNGLCSLKVTVAKENDLIKNGVVYVAKQRKHLVIKSEKDGFHLHYIDSNKVNCVCPSIDVLFESMACQVKRAATGILLTGMGSDGAIGLKKMKDAGALTIIQDEKSCVLYSMPKEAKKIKAFQKELSLQDISKYLIMHFNRKEEEK